MDLQQTNSLRASLTIENASGFTIVAEANKSCAHGGARAFVGRTSHTVDQLIKLKGSQEPAAQIGQKPQLPVAVNESQLSLRGAQVGCGTGNNFSRRRRLSNIFIGPGREGLLLLDV